MITQNGWFKFAVISLLLTAPLSNSNASDIEDSGVERKSKTGASKRESNPQQGTSAHKKRRAKNQNTAPVNNEDASRTEVEFPSIGKMPKDVFWYKIAIHLELPDILNCCVLSKAMNAHMKEFKLFFVNKNRALFRIGAAIKGIRDELMPQLIDMHLPIIPSLLTGGNYNAHRVRDSLIRMSKRNDQRGYPLTQLFYFPKDVTSDHIFAGLKELDLSGCQLHRFPSCIGQITNLESLNLSRNKLTSLPNNIGKLRRLKYIELWRNLLTKFPTGLLDCEPLELLELGGNAIIELPEDISRLTRLTKLALSSNNLKILPKSIGDLHMLKTLYLRKNFGLTELPTTMIHMQSLESVFLSGTNVDRDSNVVKKLRIRWSWSGGGWQ